MFTVEVNSVNQLDELAERWVLENPEPATLLINGEMGSGKTTFIKALCNALKCHDEVKSPTFSIVNEYQSEKAKIFHFDLYRLEHPDELYDLGFEEYLEENAYVLIEWPKIAAEFLSGNEKRLLIENKSGVREFRFS